MTGFKYSSGEEVKAGDRINCHGEAGEVEFIVAESTGDLTDDYWFMQQYPEGGSMITATGFGPVYLSGTDAHEDLEFVSRGDGSAEST